MARTSSLENRQKGTYSLMVLDAIQDLHTKEQIVTRETLSAVTGLKMTIIDDRVSYLIDEGLVHRVQRGVFIPAPRHAPARIISKTVLPDGTIKIEIGDDHILTLTPRENRMLGELMASAAVQYASIETGHHAATVSAEISAQIRDMRRDINDMTSKINHGDIA
jgi:hypothetical protein